MTNSYQRQAKAYALPCDNKWIVLNLLLSALIFLLCCFAGPASSAPLTGQEEPAVLSSPDHDFITPSSAQIYPSYPTVKGHGLDSALG